MLPIPKAAALAVGILTALSMATLGQPPPSSAQPAARSAGETLVLVGQIDWLDKSDVSALREGVIKQIEYQVGDRVEAGKPIGYLHDEAAKLAVAKAQVAANATGAIKKAEASRQLALVQLAMVENLRKLNPQNVSKEEWLKAQAELAAAGAAKEEAIDNQALAKAEMAIAQRVVEEHVITAPFTGYVTDRMKGPGESVRASEPVLRLARTDKLRFFGFLPLESAVRVHVGDAVTVRPTIDDAELPIEQKRFRGKVVALTREVSTIGHTEIQVLAEVENESDPDAIGTELLKGMKGEMTIFLSPPTAVGARLPVLPSR